jgi:hypothetical protein
MLVQLLVLYRRANVSRNSTPHKNMKAFSSILSAFIQSNYHSIHTSCLNSCLHSVYDMSTVYNCCRYDVLLLCAKYSCEDSTTSFIHFFFRGFNRKLSPFFAVVFLPSSYTSQLCTPVTTYSTCNNILALGPLKGIGMQAKMCGGRLGQVRPSPFQAAAGADPADTSQRGLPASKSVAWAATERAPLRALQVDRAASGELQPPPTLSTSSGRVRRPRSFRSKTLPSLRERSL